MRPPHRRLAMRFALVFGATIALALVAAVAIYFLERHAPRTEIHTYGDSLFWTTTQLLTVSSQLHNPVSTGARILDVFLQFWAISVVAVLAGSFGHFFYHVEEERRKSGGGSPGDLINRPLPGGPQR